MLIDLHVHTSRYSECGKSSPEEMMRQAVEIGLDGVVLTEHNVVFPADEVEALRAQFPGLHIFRGIEVTVDTGDHYLVYGLTDPAAFEPKMPSAELVRRVRAAGAATVLAHPYRYGPTVPDTLDEYPVDGVEICSNNILAYAHTRAVALCERLGAHPVAASDGHRVSTLGLYAVRLMHNHVEDEQALARAVAAGEFSLYADRERILAQNAVLPETIAQVSTLVREGRTNEEIHKALGLGYTVIRGVRDGLDIAHPTC